MLQYKTIATLVVFAAVTVGCRDTMSPPTHVMPAPAFLTTGGTGIALDQQDDLGNPLTGFTGSVTIAIGHNGGVLLPGTLSGTEPVAVVNGVATYSDLSIDQVGNGYTLVVTAAGTNGATSAPFNIGVN